MGRPRLEVADVVRAHREDLVASRGGRLSGAERRVLDDIASCRGFYRNRFTRILLVFLFSSIGSSIGTFVALPFLFPGVG